MHGWTPTLEAVGSLLRARTVDTNGNELGTFTAATRPTANQVEDIIVMAVDEVAVALAGDAPERLWGAAGSLATYRAAMLVELSYFPEQVAQGGRSPYEHYERLYDIGLPRLIANLQDPTPGNGPGVPSPPAYAFPTASTLDQVLGPSAGSYSVPNGGGLYQ